MAMLDGSPSFHCAGTFGHARSTSKLGRGRFCCPRAEPIPAARMNAARMAERVFVRFMDSSDLHSTRYKKSSAKAYYIRLPRIPAVFLRKQVGVVTGQRNTHCVH